MFKISASGTESVVHSFGAAGDGTYPNGGLIDVGGTLYGTTALGGHLNCDGGCGTIFALGPSGAETIVHAFSGSDGADPNGNAGYESYNGENLIEVDGTLYGTTVQGGLYGNGTVFAINLSSGAETVLYNFTGGADGEYPVAGLVHLNGLLYGTTSQGGSFGYGTVFAVSRS